MKVASLHHQRLQTLPWPLFPLKEEEDPEAEAEVADFLRPPAHSIIPPDFCKQLRDTAAESLTLNDTKHWPQGAIRDRAV